MNVNHSQTTPDAPVKFDPDTALERFFLFAGSLAALVVFGLVWNSVFGHSDDNGQYHPANPHGLVYLPFALFVAALSFAARFCTDNYYLVDPSGRRLLYHFKFLWLRSQSLILDRSEIQLVTTRGKKTSNDSRGVFWTYRVVVVGANGREVPITNWRDEGLAECNSEAAHVARLLDCPQHAGQPMCETRIRVQDGAASVTFTPVWLGLTRLDRWLLGGLILLLALGFLALVRFSQGG